MKLAIIGTAGRGSDADILTPAHYRMMCVVAQTVAETLGATAFVSGGAAYADHVAVKLFLDDPSKTLSLHFPAQFNPMMDAFAQGDDRYDCGRTANYYHHRFAGVVSLRELSVAINRGGTTVHVNPAGFKARNTDVANEADALLAFTFSGGPLPREGGTRDTWDKFAAKAKAEWTKINAVPGCLERPCGCTQDVEPYQAFHFDLTNRRLHRTIYRYKYLT